MTLPDFWPELRPDLESREYVSRDLFLESYSNFVNGLFSIEEELGDEDFQHAEFARYTSEYLEQVGAIFTPEEAKLFETTFNLFSIKNSLPPYSSIPNVVEFLQGKGDQELSIEMAGPIAVGKTTLATFLAEQIGAKQEKEGFEPADNPFLASSYEDPGFMLRTQLSFLLSNITVGLGGKYHTGRWVRDTSVWSDIFVYMEWRKQKGIVTEQEHETYMEVVALLEPLIPKPDLLVMLVPSSVDALAEGLGTRIDAEPDQRAMEKAVTREDLKIVSQASQSAIKIFEDLGISVATIRVDPTEMYLKPSLRYATVYQIRDRLEILRELLIRDPKEVASEIVNKVFAPINKPQVVIVHSKSMFAGKTSVLSFIAKMVGSDKIAAFQPLASIRYGEEHLNHMIDRDKRKIPATTIQNNSLEEIVKIAEKGDLDPEVSPFIFIDEVMLFVRSSAEEALKSIEDLRQMGFSVVANGIDYTFQEEPFTFIHEIIAKAVSEDGWHEVEVGTMCKYCNRQAEGSRRLTKGGEIARYSDEEFDAGDHYEPVCCEDHPSCIGQPGGFERRLLPTEL